MHDHDAHIRTRSSTEGNLASRTLNELKGIYDLLYERLPYAPGQAPESDPLQISPETRDRIAKDRPIIQTGSMRPYEDYDRTEDSDPGTSPNPVYDIKEGDAKLLRLSGGFGGEFTIDTSDLPIGEYEIIYDFADGRPELHPRPGKGHIRIIPELPHLTLGDVTKLQDAVTSALEYCEDEGEKLREFITEPILWDVDSNDIPEYKAQLEAFTEVANLIREKMSWR